MDPIWKNKTEDLSRRKEDVLAAGGADKIEQRHRQGRLSARERLEILFDKGSFVEVDEMISSRSTAFGMDRKKRPGDGVITAYGRVFGRLVFASSQDFTVGGGSLGEAHAMKICRIMDRAMTMKAPFISINDSGGARIEEGIDGLAGYADIFYRNTMASGVIPQISVIMGPCAGGACYSPAISDYIFMTDSSSQMYITGPAVVKSVIGEEISAEELGGAAMHSSLSGVAHFVYPNDWECLNGVRRLLSYLPQNNEEKAMTVKGIEMDASASLPYMVPADSRKPYDVIPVIHALVDKNSFMEIQKDFAPNLVVGLARLAGKSVGIVANQSKQMAGALDINASDKGARFIRFCDSFNIPLLTLIDVPAFLPGSQQEHAGIIRHGAKMLFAYAEASVPKISLIMRKAYGGAYIAMNSKGLGADMVFAWPIAEIAVMGASGAVAIIGRKTIEAAENPEEKRQELIEEYNRQFMNPYIAAEHGYVDEVIQPADTRRKIKEAFDMLEGKKQSRPFKKHGNIPL